MRVRCHGRGVCVAQAAAPLDDRPARHHGVVQLQRRNPARAAWRARVRPDRHRYRAGALLHAGGRARGRVPLLLLLTAGVFSILTGAAAGWVLSRAARIDRTTAFFSSVAGGAAEMTSLGERYGARPDRVALAQSVRILAVVIVVPFALTYSGVQGDDAYLPSSLPVDWPKLGLLLGLATLAGF